MAVYLKITFDFGMYVCTLNVNLWASFSGVTSKRWCNFPFSSFTKKSFFLKYKLSSWGKCKAIDREDFVNMEKILCEFSLELYFWILSIQQNPPNPNIICKQAI